MITLLSISACLTGMVGSWLYSRGMLRAAYYLSIITCSSYGLLDVVIAIRDPSQATMLLLCVPAAWGVICSISGLRRLNSWSESSVLEEPNATHADSRGSSPAC